MNTFSAEHSRAAGLQTLFTTKSGTGPISWNGVRLVQLPRIFCQSAFRKFRREPVQTIPFKQYGFLDRWPAGSPPQQLLLFRVEPLRSSASAGGSVTFAALVHLVCKYTLPRYGGNARMATYLPTGVGDVTVQQTAQDVFGSTPAGADHGRQNGVPCDLPVIDIGSFGTTQSETAPSTSAASIRLSRKNAFTLACSGPCWIPAHVAHA